MSGGSGLAVSEERSDGSPGRPRIAIFTHDTFGLGHVRRCLHIARALSTACSDAAILLVTGSPALGALGPLPPNADCVKIPTLVRRGDPQNRPPHLDLSLDEIGRLRRRLIEEAILGFAPDVFLVDNFPLGSRRELAPLLESLRDRPTRVVLGLRDIVDRPEVVREHWRRDGIPAVLERCYDRILVYGAREILDAVGAYQLAPKVARKLRYCGYVTSVERRPGGAAAIASLPRPRVLATVGGGGDGIALLQAFLQALARLNDVSALVVTGPLMSKADRALIEALAAKSGRARICRHVSDLPAQMAAADLVVAMAGYNTVAELLASGRPALLVPRTWGYGRRGPGPQSGAEGEQLLRAEALATAGLAELVHPDALDPELLAGRIAAALARRDRPGNGRFPLDGLSRATEEILALAESNEREGDRARTS